ncbi:MAG: hypothetical protein ACLQU4_19380 [Limisphaerales bacterium]
MTRKGKIARLPQSIREQINRRLQNGEEGKRIAEWLNALPEVIALLAAEFDGQPINDVNLSNWKLGGYRDWEAQQEALEAVLRIGGDSAELSQAAAGQLADQLAICLTARIAVALQRPDGEGDDPAGQLRRLRELCADLVALRKGDHNAQWLRLEREKLDLELKKYDEQAAARKEEAAAAKNPKKGGLTKETLARIEKECRLL